MNVKVCCKMDYPVFAKALNNVDIYMHDMAKCSDNFKYRPL